MRIENKLIFARSNFQGELLLYSALSASLLLILLWSLVDGSPFGVNEFGSNCRVYNALLFAGLLCLLVGLARAAFRRFSYIQQEVYVDFDAATAELVVQFGSVKRFKLSEIRCIAYSGLVGTSDAGNRSACLVLRDNSKVLLPYTQALDVDWRSYYEDYLRSLSDL